MSMVECRKCGKEVDKDSKSCPFCGQSNPAIRPGCAALIAIFLAAVLVLYIWKDSLVFPVFDYLLPFGEENVASISTQPSTSPNPSPADEVVPSPQPSVSSFVPPSETAQPEPAQPLRSSPVAASPVQAEPSPDSQVSVNAASKEIEKKLLEALDRAAWDAAQVRLEQLEKLDPKSEALAPAIKRLGDGRSESRRLSSVDEGIDASRRVASEPSKCESPVEIGKAWVLVRQAKRSDKRFRDAVAAARALEKCRKRTIATMTNELRETMIAEREQYARKLVRAALDEGLDFRISLHGKRKERLKITWPLMNRAVIHQINPDGQMTRACQEIGFREVVFSDGWIESYRYNLNPDDEKTEIKYYIHSKGLGETLKL